jgi:hypothetical protein
MISFANKKKIRGWKRRIKRIETWFENYRTPNISQFDSAGEYYIKIWIDPFYRLTKRNPPLWYFRKILDKLDLMYDEWSKKFQDHSKPFDIQIWLIEKEYVRTELECIQVEMSGDLREELFIRSTENRNFPPHFNSEIFKIGNYNWQLYKDEIYMFEKAHQLTETDMNDLLEEGFVEDIYQAGTEEQQRRFVKQIDYVWVGRKKSV